MPGNFSHGPALDMLPSKTVLSNLIQCLYQAASDPVLWGDFLNAISGVTNSSSAALLVHDASNNQHSLVKQFGIDPADTRRYYIDRKDLQDIWTHRALSVSHTGWTGLSESQSDPRELVASPFYNECLKKVDIYRGMFGVIQRAGPVLANIALYRPRNRPAFGSPDIELLQLLMPHLRLAFQLHFRLADLQSKSSIIDQAMEMLPSAVFFLTASGKILHMNQNAAAILARRDGLLAKRNELVANHPKQCAELQNLIKSAVNTSPDCVARAAGAMLIPRRAQPPLQIFVGPLGTLKHGFLQDAVAIAFVVDPSRPISSKHESLSALFGLTPAESRVAILLAEGKSLADISGIIGVSRNTVKSQMASIYSKTGTSRQSQMVRLLFEIPG
jgi:DNA-binding CsgD family transcriptional regulator/PAS domain-containing protein